MKRIIAVLTVIGIVFSLAACGAKKDETTANTPISVACLKGPTGVGTVKLMSDNEQNKTLNKYNFIIASSADEISGKIVSGEINIASVPTNLAAKLYNKTGGKLTLLAVNTLGVLSIVENGESIKKFSDLKGKTVYTTGEGSNPEYILRRLLKKNGIENDVNIHFVANNDELIASVVSGVSSVAMMPEPAATSALFKNNSLTKVLSVNDEWEKISGGSLMMGCVVALKQYAEDNAEQVENFLKEYKNSICYVGENVVEAAELCEKYSIVPAKAIAQKSIKDCNITFISGKDAKSQINDYFGVLYEYNKESIGGIPDDDFYYKSKQ